MERGKMIHGAIGLQQHEFNHVVPDFALNVALLAT